MAHKVKKEFRIRLRDKDGIFYQTRFEENAVVNVFGKIVASEIVCSKTKKLINSYTVVDAHTNYETVKALLDKGYIEEISEKEAKKAAKNEESILNNDGK